MVEGVAVDPGGDDFRDFDAAIDERGCFVMIAREQSDAVYAKGHEYCGRHFIAAAILGMPQCQVGLEGVESLFCKR